MSTTYTGTLKLDIHADFANAGDLSSVVDRLREQLETTFEQGTGANQANNTFHDTRSLATGASEDLDLAGSLANPFGLTLTFTKVKAILIFAKTTNTTNLTISRPAANGLPLFGAASDALAPLKPGGLFLYIDPSAAGITVTAGTGDLITITNAAGATAEYDVVIIGTT